MSATHARTQRRFTTLALFSCALALLIASPAHAQRRRPRRHGPPSAPAPAAAPETAPPPPAAPQPAPAQPAPQAGPAQPAPVASASPVAPLASPADPAHAPPHELAARAGQRYLDVFVGFAPFARSYEYTDDLFNRLRPYSVPFAPAVALSAAWYPAAHFTAGPGAWFGIAADGAYAVGLSSRDGANNRYTTTAFSYSVGLSVRVPIGWRVELGGRVAYAQQRFALEAAPGAGSTGGSAPGGGAAGFPSVDYRMVRVSLEGRFALARRFALLARGGYDVVLDAGELFSSAYFPRGTAGCGHATVGFAVPLVAGLELRLTVEGRRYFFAFNPEPGDRTVAGGALDQYATAALGFALRR